MNYLTIELTKYLDDPFPGILEFSLVDASQKVWRFVEKAPAISVQDFTTSSQFPAKELLACEVLSKPASSKCNVWVTTERPLGVESIEGVSEFEVQESALQKEDA